jgi:hypothetical protein
MDGSTGHGGFRRGSAGSYARYSIAAIAVWAVVLAIVHLTKREKAATYRTVFGGRLIGWTSATIARFVDGRGGMIDAPRGGEYCPLQPAMIAGN